MQAKDYFFYALMSALGSYMLFFIGKFYMTRNELKVLYPECMSLSNTYQAGIVMTTWVTIALSKKIVL